MTGLSPATGPTTGGTTVTITGTNFLSGVTTVSFGSAASPSVNVISSTQLTAVTPVEAEGQVPVTATNVALTSPGNAPATTFQFANPGPMHAITLSRVCDTRPSGGTPCSGSGNAIPVGGSRDIQVTGVGGLPAEPGIAAVVADLAVIPTAAGSYGNIGVYPTGLAGGANGLSWGQGSVETVLTELPVSPTGQVTVANAPSPYSTSSVDITLDVEAYVTDSQTDASGLINSLSPNLFCDTASASGTPCAVANNAGWASGSTHTISVPTPAGASAAVLDIVVYGNPGSGYLTIYPSNQSMPGAAAMTYNAGAPSTNHMVVPLAPGNTINVYTLSGTQVRFYLDGWITDNSNTSATGGLYNPSNGVLVCDTRAGSGTGTPCASNGKLSTANSPMPVQVAGMGGVPATSSAITAVGLELTLTNVTLGPNGAWPNICVSGSATTCPEYDILTNGGVPANLLVVVPVDSSGKVYVYIGTGSADVLLAVTGYYTTSPSTTPGLNLAVWDSNPPPCVAGQTLPVCFDTSQPLCIMRLNLGYNVAIVNGVASGSITPIQSTGQCQIDTQFVLLGISLSGPGLNSYSFGGPVIACGSYVFPNSVPMPGQPTCPANTLAKRGPFSQPCANCGGTWTLSGFWTIRFLEPIVAEIVANQNTDRRCKQDPSGDPFVLVCSADLSVVVP